MKIIHAQNNNKKKRKFLVIQTDNFKKSKNKINKKLNKRYKMKIQYIQITKKKWNLNLFIIHLKKHFIIHHLKHQKTKKHKLKKIFLIQ